MDGRFRIFPHPTISVIGRTGNLHKLPIEIECKQITGAAQIEGWLVLLQDTHDHTINHALDSFQPSMWCAEIDFIGKMAKQNQFQLNGRMANLSIGQILVPRPRWCGCTKIQMAAFESQKRKKGLCRVL